VPDLLAGLADWVGQAGKAPVLSLEHDPSPNPGGDDRATQAFPQRTSNTEAFVRRHPIEARRKKYAPVQKVADYGGYTDKEDFDRKYNLKAKSVTEKPQRPTPAVRRRSPP
jgi:hypothetical protein